MLGKLKNDDIVITSDKKRVLKYLTDNKKILNLRIMSLNEFRDKYFGTYDERAIYYLIKKYNYKYDVAKLYLDNYLFIDDLKKELEDNDLIIKDNFFLSSIKRIVTININVDDYLKKEINKYENINLIDRDKNYVHPVYEFNTLEDEVDFVCQSILKLLKDVSINKIFLVNVNEEYLVTLKRLFKFYNIPINLNIKNSIYSMIEVKNFINELKLNKNIELALNKIENDNIHNIIINICNKYAFSSLDDTMIYLLEEEIKKASLNDVKLSNAVNVCDIDEINEDDYYFILGFNQDSIPKVYKDEDYLSDIKKQEYGILTSNLKNIYEKEKIKKIISNTKNLVISYKLKSIKEDYYKSPLIDEMNLEIKKENIDNYNYSNLYNKIVLSKKLDKLIKFNEIDNDLSLLYSNYKNIPYLTYNNNYKDIEKELFLKYIKENLLLSYSSIDNYYRCGFRYYLSNVLKLNKNEETFMTYIGNLFHYILSKAFIDNFDFELEFNNYIKDKEFNNKEQFFLNKLKSDLIFTIDTIKKQENYTDLTNSLYEQKIYIKKDKNIKVTFMGIIDKLKYKQYEDNTVVAIIDYKTGNPDIDLNNLNYGVSMQLPIYLYLASNSSLKNVTVAGFYLQKVIHSKLNYQEKNYNDELEKLYRLEGYSNSDTDILSKFDKGYTDSNVIKAMKTSSKGFYHYAKVLDNDQINKIINTVDKKIDDAINDILNVRFDINPKRIGLNLKGCEYCKFKDICYMKEENIVNLKEMNYQEFLKGDEDA